MSKNVQEPTKENSIIVEIEYRSDDGRPPITKQQAIEIGDKTLNESTLIALAVNSMVHDVTLNQAVTEATIRIPSRCGKNSWNEPCPDCGKIHAEEHRKRIEDSGESVLPDHIHNMVMGIHEQSKEKHLTEALELAWSIISNVSGGDWEKQDPEWRKAAKLWRDEFYLASPQISVHEITKDGLKEISVPGLNAPATQNVPTLGPTQFITGQNVTVYDHSEGKFEGRVIRCDETKEMVLVRNTKTNHTQWYYYMQLDAIDKMN